MESLTAKIISILEKAREEHTFNNVWSQDGKVMFFDKGRNKVLYLLQLIPFFFSNEPDQLWGKNVLLLM